MKIILLVFMLFSVTVSAEETKPMIWGYGTKSCTSFITTYKAWDEGKQEQVLEYIRYRDWLTGFISALTLATGSDVMRGVEPKNAMRRINLYCEENQGKDFFTATLEFIKVIGTNKRQSNDVGSPEIN